MMKKPISKPRTANNAVNGYYVPSASAFNPRYM
jgi:hypothetical protein